MWNIVDENSTTDEGDVYEILNISSFFFECAETLDNFLSNIAKNLEIPEFNRKVTLVDNISHPILKGILKYRNHLSTIAIKKLELYFYILRYFNFCIYFYI